VEWPTGRAILCLVTDRRRLAPGGGPLALDAVVAQAAGAAGAGVDLVQVREPDLEARALAALVARLLEALHGTSARVIVNDRLDAALAGGAHGVHLRSDSPPASRVRRLAPPPMLVGRSVHGEAEAQDAVRAGGLDYLIAGTLFPTASKPAGHPTLGLEAFGRLAAASPVPVLAIGGVSLARAAEVRAAGGTGLAAIGVFLPRPGGAPGAAAADAVRRLRHELDAGGRGRSDTLGLGYQ
jgi:thiamine-phosphate pyrophosphorylase